MLRYWILSFLLLVAAAGRAQILLSENFNTGLPVTWTVVNGGSNAVTWQRTTNGLGGQTLNGTQFMICNSDAAGNIPPVYLHEELVSPAVNAAGQPLVYLEFDHYFRHNGLTDSAHVDVWDGNAWHRIVSYASTIGGFSMPAHQQYNISAYANANLKMRFIYDDNNTWAWYWALDNVLIIAPSPFDVGISAFINPINNGRRYTSSALSATEPVQVTVHNLGSVAASNVPVYMQVDGGPILGPTTLTGPINPSQFQNLLLSNTANLAAIGTHTLRAWTQLPNDADPGNDTLTIQLQQLPNDPPAFPHCITFESLPDTSFQSFSEGLANVEEADFYTNVVGSGRLRTFAGPGFAYAGTRAATLDRNPSGAPDAINYITFTWNLGQFHVASDVLLADLWLMEHGDEVQLHDSIWVRGCDNCAWIDVLAWNNLTGGTNGVYFQTATLNLTTLLQSRGQDYSSSFQLRVGQEDNFPATSLTGSDGLTIDNVCLRRILPINAGVTALPSPQVQGGCGDSATPVTVTTTNFGTVSLSNVPVRAVVSGGTSATFTAILPGPIAPGGTLTATLGTINTLVGGNYQITAFTLVAGDSSRGDDTLRVNAVLAPQLIMPVALGDTFCIGDSGWVQVLNPNPALQYSWYDLSSGGNLLGLGDSLQVGPQFAPGNYYVEPRSYTRAHLGPVNNQFGMGGDFAGFSEGLVLDALTDIVIDSVLIYPSDTGIVRLVLFDNTGLALDSVDVQVNPSFTLQPMQIPVGLAVPQGMGYALRARGSNIVGLYRNNAGANYPYVLSGVAQITGPVNGLAGYYYFFYDWVVRYGNCPGPRGLATTDTTSAAPVAAFSSTHAGLQAQFSNASAHASTYDWDFGDGQSSSNIAPTHVYALNGNYNVCLIAHGYCGEDTTCLVVTVDCLPIQAGFVANVNLLSLQVSDTTQYIVGHHWDFGDGQSATGANAQHTYATDGNYVVCLQNWNACGDTAQYCDSLTLCASLTATIGFTANGLQFTFSNTGSGTPVSWQWNFGDGGQSNLASPSHTYAAAGSYVVTLVVTNLCGASHTATMNITVVGINEAHAENVRLFPNPMSGKATLELPGAWEGAYTLRVHDGLGRTLELHTVHLRGNRNIQTLEINLHDVTNGQYWLELQGDDGHIALPFLLQR